MTLIKTYFTRQLDKLGYPTHDINYSLGHCQGDGMAFYGDIEEDGLVVLADRLMTGTEKAAVKRCINKGCSVTITRNGWATHYSHFNCMDVVGEDYYAEDLTDFEQAAFDTFIEKLDNDVSDTSKQLESDGYDIIEAGSQYGALDGKTREYNTARFTVRIEEMEDEDFSMDMWDESLIDETLQAFIDGKQRYFTLKVSVIAKDDDVELGTSYLGGCIENNENPSRTYGGYLPQQVREAIEEARHFIDSVSLAA